MTTAEPPASDRVDGDAQPPLTMPTSAAGALIRRSLPLAFRTGAGIGILARESLGVGAAGVER